MKMENKEGLRDRIIIALDVGTKREALALAGELKDAHVFKIGMELFTAEGPALLDEAAAMGKRPFLDLKYHDIPNTVAGAVRSAARHHVHMLTLHASGGKEMMAAAVRAADEESARTGKDKPILLGVTVLTSLKDEELRRIGFARAMGPCPQAGRPGERFRIGRSGLLPPRDRYHQERMRR
jgi:orotidine-5'-phosphate decarboxylase